MLNKFHSYTNPLNEICLQLKVTETPPSPTTEEALDTFIQEDLETVIRCYRVSYQMHRPTPL